MGWRNLSDTSEVITTLLEESMRGAAAAVNKPSDPCPDCRDTGRVARSNGMYVRCGKCYGTRWADK